MPFVDSRKVPKPPPVRCRDSRRISRRETATNPGGLNPETVRKIGEIPGRSLVHYPAISSLTLPHWVPLSLTPSLTLSLALLLSSFLILPHFSTPDFLSFSFSCFFSLFTFFFFPPFFSGNPDDNSIASARSTSFRRNWELPWATLPSRVKLLSWQSRIEGEREKDKEGDRREEREREGS